MPTTRTLLGAAAFSLALAGGGAAGALLGTPATSGAQDEPTTTTGPVDATEVPPGRPLLAHRGERLTAAADALGVTEEELRAALEAGRSIAQVAEAEGVDVQVVVDALVADATERLAEIEAALPERMTELVNRAGLPDRGPDRHPHRPANGPGGGWGDDEPSDDAS
jgi:hypothetical protein